MANRTSKIEIPSGLLKGKWLPALISLVVGLALGTSFGREILDSAGFPASCVRAIQRASKAIDSGKEVADNGKSALAAVKELRIGQAASFLSEARDRAVTLISQAQRFDDARRVCDADRE